MGALSSDHFSVDAQVEDAMFYLEHNHPDEFARIVEKFPEWNTRTMGEHSSWFDTESMGVEPDWSSWLVDAIEDTGLVLWEEGEPWLIEEGE